MTKLPSTAIELNYAQAVRRRRWLVWSVSSFALLLSGSFALTICVKDVETRVDNITGSIACRTTWPLGLTTNSWYAESFLEARLRQLGIAWQPSWTVVHRTQRSLLDPTNTGFHGTGMPPIFNLQPVMNRFVSVSSPSELSDFVRVMQSGTPNEQRAAIDLAREKATP